MAEWESRTLTFGAPVGTIPTREQSKAIRLSFIQNMKQKFVWVVAISPEPGAITALRRERNMLPPNDFPKPSHWSYIDY